MEDKKLPRKDLIHELEPRRKRDKKVANIMTKPIVFTVVVMLVLGIGTGYIASNVSGFGSSQPESTDGNVPASEIKKGFTAGVNDPKQFKDTAEGNLKVGGVDGEGAYHLERPGGESQNVYMTSSVVDLSKFVGMKVKVWGQTQTAQTAGWLMDVGKIEVQ